ncbi:glutamyl-tRNA amidotransferase [Caminibacter sp.]
MDKPVPFWLIILTVLILVGGSYLIYLWLKSIKID